MVFLVSLTKRIENELKWNQEDNLITVEKKDLKADKAANTSSLPQDGEAGAKERNHAVKAGTEVRHKAEKLQH